LLVPIIELNKMYTFDRKAKEGALYWNNFYVGMCAVFVESVVNGTGIDLLAKESMRCWILGRAHTAKFSLSSHRICMISTRVNGRMSAHIPLLWMSTCSNGKFIHEIVFLLPLSPHHKKLFPAWPLHPACWWTE
jgi:hypothetical protein